EIGLDYYYEYSGRDVQKSVFRRQMTLARELGLPVVIHDRDAHADCLEIVRAFPDVPGVFHCYSGSAEMAAEILKMGWYLGFGGTLTFKNARKTVETLEICPDDRILLETDCPYLAPVPHRGERNDSRFLSLVAEKIAGIRRISRVEVAEMTARNGRRFFGLA
ncbi:MAG: TatD family hydrolase, partial [Oscillospiraceae bacterium]|nr:TatD family hydrolase [Oscillospiraceae bacterium]